MQRPGAGRGRLTVLLPRPSDARVGRPEANRAPDEERVP